MWSQIQTEKLQEQQHAIILVTNPTAQTANSIVNYAENIFICAFVVKGKFAFYDIQNQLFIQELPTAYKMRLNTYLPTNTLKNTTFENDKIYIKTQVKF